MCLFGAAVFMAAYACELQAREKPHNPLNTCKLSRKKVQTLLIPREICRLYSKNLSVIVPSPKHKWKSILGSMKTDELRA